MLQLRFNDMSFHDTLLPLLAEHLQLVHVVKTCCTCDVSPGGVSTYSGLTAAVMTTSCLKARIRATLTL